MSNQNMCRKGMTLFHDGKDYFFVTKQTKRTDKLLRHIATTMRRSNGYPNTVLSDILDSTVDFLRFRVEPATLEWKRTGTGRTYYNIRTANGCTAGCTLGEDLIVYELEV